MSETSYAERAGEMRHRLGSALCQTDVPLRLVIRDLERTLTSREAASFAISST